MICVTAPFFRSVTTRLHYYDTTNNNNNNNQSYLSDSANFNKRLVR